MKLTNSNSSVLRKLDGLGQNHDLDLTEAKEKISNENKFVQRAEERYKEALMKHTSHNQCSPDCYDELKAAMRNKKELKKAAHPGFVISFDNLDIHLQRKNMTMESQNRDFHWVNHQMVENRVSGNTLDSSKPRANILDVDNIKFLPTLNDQYNQRLNYTILCSRILVSYFDVLAPLSDVCIQHIPHKYSKELSQKTKKVGHLSEEKVIPNLTGNTFMKLKEEGKTRSTFCKLPISLPGFSPFVLPFTLLVFLIWFINSLPLAYMHLFNSKQSIIYMKCLILYNIVHIIVCCLSKHFRFPLD